MFDVIFPRQGAVLSRHDGCESASGLTIKVTGFCDVPGAIAVNGKPARRTGRTFESEITLDACFNTVSVRLDDDFGATIREIQVLYDRNSFPRYDFFIDDNIFFLTDLAKELPKSLFDQFYLNFLQSMHRKYGTCFTLNIFYRNDHEDFDLSRMPDRYRGEFADNADWLKLAFHAYSEFPDRPYQNTPPEKIAADFDLVVKEIDRFAGHQSYIPMEALHWAMARPSSLVELHRRGIRLLEGQFLSPRTGISDAGNDGVITDVGYFCSPNDSIYLKEKHHLYDFRTRMMFSTNDCTANLLTPDEIQRKLSGITADTIGLATHEQYSYTRYFNYLPDHFERIETSIRIASERGYRPVFFVDGLFGNQSWGKDVLP